MVASLRRQGEPTRATRDEHEIHRKKKNDQESDWLVAEGQVKVLNRTGSNPGGGIQEVHAGQVALIGPHGTEVHAASDSEVERRMAWIEGTLDFDETLKRAVEEFNRYNERKLFIDDPTLDALPVTGRFDAHNPDLFAEDLQKSHHIDHTSIGNPGSKAAEIHLKPGLGVSVNLSRAPIRAP
jgi:ferric-dicitrate binding protein FerR (iron transport regulator)